MLFHCYVLAFGRGANAGYQKGNFVETLGNLSTSQYVVELLRPWLFSLVSGFFILSGFLVIGSAVRTRSIRVFLTFRVLRILPALLTEVSLSAIVLGPLLTTLPLEKYFTDPLFGHYFLNIVGFVNFLLPGLFENNPYPRIVNANLWTLPAEFYCYLLLVVAMLLRVAYSRSSFAAAVVALGLGLLIAEIFGFMPTRLDNTRYTTLLIVYFFFVGACLYLYADRVPIRGDLFVSSLLAFYLLNLFHLSDVLGGICLAYAVVFIGSCNFSRFDRLLGGDYSYGIYLYGYPITQTMVALTMNQFAGLPGYAKLLSTMALSLSLTLLFAALSWKHVEKPFLSLKRFLLSVPSQSRVVAEKPLASSASSSSA